ncbi:hypothetical protein BZL30_5469 [Mycobacterium kansasii]|uniref:Uncharacterized protein n=1 Tax=Mycobacterium kansasii TaxID=1768 RepID=A0A1V3WYH3_MYCKA|nr:hypothetical protein BZL30_5469 [Mycobacterium kansasii]
MDRSRDAADALGSNGVQVRVQAVALAVSLSWVGKPHFL